MLKKNYDEKKKEDRKKVDETILTIIALDSFLKGYNFEQVLNYYSNNNLKIKNEILIRLSLDAKASRNIG